MIVRLIRTCATEITVDCFRSFSELETNDSSNDNADDKDNVIAFFEDEFNRRWKNNEKLTDTAKNNNEWVLFNSNDIYMQVIDQGCGDYIKKGTSVDVLVRFDEYNLSYAAEMSDKCP